MGPEVASENLTTFTVLSDQDIKHMLEEHNRHQTEGLPVLRAFLFHTTETRNHPVDLNAMKQCNTDAINGLTRSSLTVKVTAPTIPNQPFNNISSPCTSPNSSYSLASLPEPPVLQETCSVPIIFFLNHTCMRENAEFCSVLFPYQYQS